MKLPRLGSPKVTRIKETTFLGETTETEIIEVSQWDLLPTWFQYLYVGLVLGTIIGLIVHLVLK